MTGRNSRIVALSVGLLVALAAAVILVPLLSKQDPITIGDVLALRLLPPFSRDHTGAFHLLGTDRFGRDLFVRMMLAGRISVAVGIVGSLFASAVGTAVGAAAAWMGGLADRTLMAISDTLLAERGDIHAAVPSELTAASLATGPRGRDRKSVV